MDAKKRFGWEPAARRTLQSEKIEIAALPGYWFKARKYSVSGNDEIQAEMIRKRDRIPAEVRALMGRAGAEGKTIDQLIAELPPDKAEAMAQAIPPDASSTEGVMRITLKHGLGETNLSEDENGPITDALIDRLLDYPDVAAELFKAIQEWNSPLAKKTSET